MFNEWRQQTLIGAFDYVCEHQGQQVALSNGLENWTYLQLQRQVDSLAAGLLEIGVEGGDRIAYLLGGTVEWVQLYYAAMQIGAVLVPLNLTWQSLEIRQGLSLTDANWLVVQEHFRGADRIELLEEMAPDIAGQSRSSLTVDGLPELRGIIIAGESHSSPGTYTYAYTNTEVADLGKEYEYGLARDRGAQVSPNDQCMLLLTSGSTSFPKPVIHTHSSLLFSYSAYADAAEVKASDAWLMTGTTYHISAFLCLCLPHLRGASVYLMTHFDAEEAMRMIEQHQITSTWGFDLHFLAMRQHPRFGAYDISSLDRILLGSNPGSFEQIRELGASYHGNIYANSESAACAAFFPYRARHDLERMKFSHGHAPAGVSLQIIDPETGNELPVGEPGEICINGPQLFQGYYKMADETKAAFLPNGFHRTGDYGWLDEEGYLYYRGRFKEVIKSGGENVSIIEVENQLRDELDNVSQVVVVGLPSPKWGEMVVALVEIDSNVPPDVDTLKAQCRGKMAGYKVPKHFLIVERKDWISTPTGKIARGELRKLAASRLGIDLADAGG